jgi:hypothetical protein
VIIQPISGNLVDIRGKRVEKALQSPINADKIIEYSVDS